MIELNPPIRFSGIVVHGDKRGRQLGFPTANLNVSPHTDVEYGVYASETTILGNSAGIYLSVTSIGNRPTFYGGDSRIETHILDFDRDIYDLEIEVCLLAFLRPERRFASIDDLIAAMKHDTLITRSRERLS